MFLGIGYVKLDFKNYEQTLTLFKQKAMLKVMHEDDDGVVFQFPNGDLLEINHLKTGSDSSLKVGFLVGDVGEVLDTLYQHSEKTGAKITKKENLEIASFTGLDGTQYGLVNSDQQNSDRLPKNKILFYGPHSENGYLGNWYMAPLYLKGVIWPTSEHYYQAQKFIHPVDEELCRRLQTPRETFEMTRREDVEIRSDWDDVKVDVMRDAVYAKFSQNPDLKERLLNTGDAELVENSPVDYFWGIGQDGSGKNVLGKILMEVRDQLKEQK